jgi:hypothetical protein
MRPSMRSLPGPCWPSESRGNPTSETVGEVDFNTQWRKPQYCAYHTHGTTTKGTALYAAMPHNQDSATSCTPNFASPNTDVAANSEVNTLAHEIEETTTDPMGTAWYDSRGQENGDKCAWTWGTTYTAANGGKYDVTFADGKQYMIQRNWVNAGSGGCAISY